MSNCLKVSRYTTRKQGNSRTGRQGLFTVIEIFDINKGNYKFFRKFMKYKI